MTKHLHARFAVWLLLLVLACPQAMAAEPAKPLSSASQRALAWPEGSDWYCEFTVTDLKGDLAFDEKVIRRDPSAVLFVDGLYHVWYTHGVGETVGFHSGDPDAKVFPWDQTDVWWATSPDGVTWTERGLAVGRGPRGAYDDRAVFTPEVLAHDGRYYLVYQTVKAPYLLRTNNTVGMAIADSPAGPWRKLAVPILHASADGEWYGAADDRRLVVSRGSFDSHKVHDPCVVPFQGRFAMYYKGEQMGERVTFGGRDIRWGVAFADRPEGPYTKSPLNPVTNSGHEVCVWPYRGGIAALLTTDGPERNTIQYAPDGLNFEIVGAVRRPPHAIGLVRSLDSESHPLAALEWGLCHEYRGGSQHLRRFESRRRERPPLQAP